MTDGDLTAYSNLGEKSMVADRTMTGPMSVHEYGATKKYIPLVASKAGNLS
jgi:hypothetical protein